MLTYSAGGVIYITHANKIKLLFPGHNPRLQLTINDYTEGNPWRLAFYYSI